MTATADHVTCDLDPAVEADGVEKILQGLTEEERAAMPDSHMPLRHFRAEKGDAEKALKQIKETLAWRKEFQVDTLRDCFKEQSNNTAENDDEKKEDGSIHTTAKEFRDILSQENSTGKLYVRGYDKHGHAVVYMRPGRENTHNERNNMRHLVWNMEKAIAATERKGNAKITFVIDYEGFSLSQAPPLSTARYTLDIMQKHYPERCFRFYLTHPPFIFRAFWAAVRPFIDPHTKQKINFCNGKTNIAWLLEEMGGDASKVEEWVGGTNANLKPFHSKEYLSLPFDETFDEEAWK